MLYLRRIATQRFVCSYEDPPIGTLVSCIPGMFSNTRTSRTQTQALTTLCHEGNLQILTYRHQGCACSAHSTVTFTCNERSNNRTRTRDSRYVIDGADVCVFLWISSPKTMHDPDSSLNAIVVSDVPGHGSSVLDRTAPCVETTEHDSRVDGGEVVACESKPFQRVGRAVDE
jgi:hypothetical protein